MPTETSATSYVLGSTDTEHKRLIRQAAIFNPISERLFHEAGVGPGQRVLDVGSGLGDVSMLIARLWPFRTGRRCRQRRDHNRESEGACGQSRVSEYWLHAIRRRRNSARRIVRLDRRPIDSRISAGSGRGRKIARGLTSAGRHPGYSGWLLGSASCTLGRSADPIKVRDINLSSIPELGCEHGYGTRFIQDFPGSWTAGSHDEDRSAGRR